MSEGDKPLVLFVDDEPALLAGLRSSLRKQRKVWDLDFAEGGTLALELAAERAPAVIVSDMRMPGMDGATLLHQIREDFPETLRIILTGEADEQAALRAIPVAQQWLSKPCSRERLIAAIERALRTRSFTDKAGIVGIGGTEALPSPPHIVEAIRDVTSNPECNIEDVVHVIEKDPGLATKLLQLVNSAYFALPREVSEVHEAVTRLGLHTVTTLTFASAAFVCMAPDEGALSEFVEEIQDHASLCSRIAGHLAVEVGGSPGLTASAGLLHDVGMLVLASRFDETLAATIARADRENISIEEAEAGGPGPDHSTLGGALLSAWGLPTPLVEAVANHHGPLPADAELHTRLVHVANVLADEIGTRHRGSGVSSKLDEDMVRRSGWTEFLPAWRSIAEEEVGIEL